VAFILQVMYDHLWGESEEYGAARHVLSPRQIQKEQQMDEKTDTRILKEISALRREFRKITEKQVPMLLSAREAAEMIGMSYGAFRTLKSTKPGYLPPAVIRNGCLVWKRKDIEDWIDNLQEEC